MVAASFLDNYNKIVQQIRDQPQLIKSSSAAGDANAAASTKAEAPQQAGQTLCAKIANVKIYAGPAKEGKVTATIGKTEELIASGEAKNGFVFVDAANFSGWVQRTLVGPCNGVAAAPVATPMVTAPGGIYGAFAGSFMGSDQGSFTVTVMPNGMVSGQGTSVQTGAFVIQGVVAPNGRLNLNASGQAGAAVFSGAIDPASGVVSGTWRMARGNGSGSFIGGRQAQ